ncbi:MAG: S-layer homology domain-containing protein [Oscillospiraceae bacterium]|nr:S-layer homology domain-containing protein [Oscillospiraceae bacterium]
MKKRVMAFLLCLSLLPFGSVYAAGSQEDPFISKSYIDGTFIPAVESVVKALLETLNGDLEDSISPSTGMVTEELPAAKDIVLTSGQSIILLSGSAKISKEKGSIVNATMGLEAGSGAIYKNHRYIICEDSSATVHILSESMVYISAGAEVKDGVLQSPAPVEPSPSASPVPSTSPTPTVKPTAKPSAAPTITPAAPIPAATPSATPKPTSTPTPTSTPAPASDEEGSLPFTDVRAGNRYYKAILGVYNKGLINGITPTLFAPGNELTLAEALKLAAGMHQLDSEGRIHFESEAIWYKPYLDYCLENGIVSGNLSGFNEPITRREFVEIIYRSLPEKSYSAINIIPNNSIDDVDASSSWGKMVYSFYRAGILTGVTADGGHSVHDFAPDDFINRAEAAAIINRMLDEDARIPFVIS